MCAIVAGVTLLPASAASAQGPTGGPAGEPTPNVTCYYDDFYSPSSRDADDHIAISPQQRNTNNTGQTAQTTFTSTATGTVSLEVSAGVTVKAGVIVSGVEASIGIKVATSLSIT
jgi:hypothetical protein